MDRLAYIDDNQHNLDYFSHLFRHTFELMPYTDPIIFLEQFQSDQFAGILLDIHMPIMNGFVVYQKIIEHLSYNGCPIFFISSDDSEVTRIQSLNLGAVDFLDRSMAPDEMNLRILSRIQYFEKNSNCLEFEKLKLNLTLIKGYLNQEELKLTFIEFKLLHYLLKNHPRPIPKEELGDKVWMVEFVMDATIYTHFFNLNSKLEDWNYEVVMERNKGARLSNKKRKK